MLIKMPTPADRANTRTMILEQYRSQYRKIGRNHDCPSASNTATTQYSKSETEALTIVGGHQPMPRPEQVDLPKDFRKKIGKGVMSLKDLATYGSESKRMLCS